MDGERAESYLRGLAEVELRYVMRPGPVPAGRWSADRAAATLDRMSMVTLALIGVRALDIETAEAVLADYAHALGARPRSDQVRPVLRDMPPLPRGPWRAPWFT